MIKATKISSILSTKNVHTRLYRKGRDPLNEFYGDNLIFVHTRTSGLNEQKDLLLEIACAITTKDLQLLSESGNFHIGYTKEQLANIPSDLYQKYEKNGLLSKVLASTNTPLNVETNLLRFINQYSVTNRFNYMFTGNSIHLQKPFLDWHFPQLMRRFKYRIMDVSGLKELNKRWIPSDSLNKETENDLDPDLPSDESVRKSINDFVHMRKVLFK